MYLHNYVKINRNYSVTGTQNMPVAEHPSPGQHPALCICDQICNKPKMGTQFALCQSITFTCFFKWFFL